MGRVAVDLTPLALNGENGGLGLLTKIILPQLIGALPNCDFVLLTSYENHDYAARFEAANTKRLCVVGAPGPDPHQAVRLALHTASALTRRSPLRVREWLMKSHWTRVQQDTCAGLRTKLDVDLVYSPLMSVRFLGRVPSVVVVPDLLFAEYPEYFAREDLWFREWQFETARRLASKIVCVSNHARQVMLQGGARSGAIASIYPLVHLRVPQLSQAEVSVCLERFGLRPSRYLLYPANCWPHKNHSNLIDAFAAYCRESGDRATELVLTGAETSPRAFESLRSRAGHWVNRVHYLGYLPEESFLPVLQGAKALVFPSLYEGFGQAVAEAMHCGIPVVCGAVAALPEVTQDAALFCDPSNIGSITNALLRLNDPELRQSLVRRGRERARALGTLDQMICKYVSVFEDVLPGVSNGPIGASTATGGR